MMIIIIPVTNCACIWEMSTQPRTFVLITVQNNHSQPTNCNHAVNTMRLAVKRKKKLIMARAYSYKLYTLELTVSNWGDRISRSAYQTWILASAVSELLFLIQIKSPRYEYRCMDLYVIVRICIVNCFNSLTESKGTYFK